ncbi:hypothetical protein ACIA5H_36700 [Nocardia sp. NPDC051900]|uniref:hypothetical protein n=1 Tax=Nocardia sp. NPDC051900 TaxID=3364326 RepID=UPI0037BA3B59
MSARRTAGAAWQRISADSILARPPSTGVSGDVGAGRELRLDIGWDRFEQLLVSVAQGIIGLDQMRFRRYGVGGQKQHGIDLAGRHPDTGDYTVVQCKDYRRFTVTNLRAAVRTFTSGKRPFGARHLIVAVSTSAATTQLEDELATLQDVHNDLTIELWGAEQINDELRSHPEIVGRFWTRETADTFCTGAPLPGVAAPPVNLVRLADQILVGPIRMDGLEDDLAAADVLRGADPAAAAAAYQRIADTLAAEGFRGHSHVVQRKQLDALDETDDHLAVAALIAELAAVALYEADSRQAQALSRRLAKLDPQSGMSALEALIDESARANRARRMDQETLIGVRRHGELIEAAVDATVHPLPATSKLRTALRRALADSAPPDYQPLLVLLLAEMTHAEAILAPSRAIVTDWAESTDSGTDVAATSLDELDDLITAAIEQLAQASPSDQGREASLRLRLVRGYYNTDERRTLLTAARQRRLPEKSAALILAAHARREALDGSAEEAIEHWRQAVASAIHGGHTDDAGGWLYAIQAVKARYGPWTVGGDDYHSLAQALPTASSGRLIRRVRDPEADARRAALANNPREAIVAARRWLADSIVVGDWVDENTATELLGDLYADNTELARAACCYQRAGAIEKLRALIDTAGDRLLPMVSPVGSGPWWQQKAALVQISAQQDLLDDDTVVLLVKALLELVGRGRNGELTDDPGDSLTVQATKTLCVLAGRGDAVDAKGLLDILADDVPRSANHYRYHDSEHVRACISILVHHPEMAWHALKRVFDLAEAGTDAALDVLHQPRVIDALATPAANQASPDSPSATVLTGRQRSILRKRLRTMAAAGRYDAGLAIASLGEADDSVTERATRARDRLLKRPEPEGYSIEHGTRLVSDSYLVSFLELADQQACLYKVMAIAEDRRASASNRQDALKAAANLVIDQDDRLKTEVHLRSRTYVTGEQDGSFLDAETSNPHPLSALRVDLGPTSLRADGMRLAFNSSTTDDHRDWLRHHAIDLLGSPDTGTVRRAAHVLSWLGATGVGDLDAAILAGHPLSTMRELAAVVAAAAPTRWASTLRALARDDASSVRLVLAQQLRNATDNAHPGSGADTDGRAVLAEVLDRLRADTRHSVRRAAVGLDS